MEKKEDLSREDVSSLNQLALSLGEAQEKLEDTYERKDYNGFNEAKKFMLGIQKKISGVLK